MSSKYKMKPARMDGIKTYPIASRESKVRIDQFSKPLPPSAGFAAFLSSLPDVLAGKSFKRFVGAMRKARQEGRPMIFGMGAHVIKVGLSPVFIDLMEEGWITALLLNGAGIIHDFEIAYAGKTSEDVAVQLDKGRFGMASETGEMLNAAINEGASQGLGMGESIGKMLVESRFPHTDFSLLAAAYRRDIPVTVHVAVGTDTIHLHPDASGEAIGETTLRDFHLFCSLVEKLEGGIFCSIGSSVIIPEVFLKGLSYARNKGINLDPFTTAVFDFNRHYRPEQNIQKRPPRGKGEGFYFIGHHELMIPLLAASLKSPE